LEGKVDWLYHTHHRELYSALRILLLYDDELSYGRWRGRYSRLQAV